MSKHEQDILLAAASALAWCVGNLEGLEHKPPTWVTNALYSFTKLNGEADFRERLESDRKRRAG